VSAKLTVPARVTRDVTSALPHDPAPTRIPDANADPYEGAFANVRVVSPQPFVETWCTRRPAELLFCPRTRNVARVMVPEIPLTLNRTKPRSVGEASALTETALP